MEWKSTIHMQIMSKCTLICRALRKNDRTCRRKWMFFIVLFGPNASAVMEGIQLCWMSLLKNMPIDYKVLL